MVRMITVGVLATVVFCACRGHDSQQPTRTATMYPLVTVSNLPGLLSAQEIVNSIIDERGTRCAYERRTATVTPVPTPRPTISKDTFAVLTQLATCYS